MMKRKPLKELSEVNGARVGVFMYTQLLFRLFPDTFILIDYYKCSIQMEFTLRKKTSVWIGK